MINNHKETSIELYIKNIQDNVTVKWKNVSKFDIERWFETVKKMDKDEPLNDLLLKLKNGLLCLKTFCNIYSSEKIGLLYYGLSILLKHDKIFMDDMDFFLIFEFTKLIPNCKKPFYENIKKFFEDLEIFKYEKIERNHCIHIFQNIEKILALKCCKCQVCFDRVCFIIYNIINQLFGLGVCIVEDSKCWEVCFIKMLMFIIKCLVNSGGKKNIFETNCNKLITVLFQAIDIKYMFEKRPCVVEYMHRLYQILLEIMTDSKLEFLHNPSVMDLLELIVKHIEALAYAEYEELEITNVFKSYLQSNCNGLYKIAIDSKNKLEGSRVLIRIIKLLKFSLIKSIIKMIPVFVVGFMNKFLHFCANMSSNKEIFIFLRVPILKTLMREVYWSNGRTLRDCIFEKLSLGIEILSHNYKFSKCQPDSYELLTTFAFTFLFFSIIGISKEKYTLFKDGGKRVLQMRRNIDKIISENDATNPLTLIFGAIASWCVTLWSEKKNLSTFFNDKLDPDILINCFIDLYSNLDEGTNGAKIFFIEEIENPYLFEIKQRLLDYMRDFKTKINQKLYVSENKTTSIIQLLDIY